MAASRVAEEESRRLLGFPRARSARSSSRRLCRWWLPPLRRLFGRRRPGPIPVCKPLDAKQLKRYREERIRAMEPGHIERLARDRRPVMEFLSHYNSMNPHNLMKKLPKATVSLVSPFGVVSIVMTFIFCLFAADCICKTCYRRYDFRDESVACGHNKTERICEMCYGRSGVLHPFAGEFAYGYRAYLNRFY